MPLQKAPRRRRRDKTTTIVLGGNPSVSLAAASSPCTGEAMGWSAAYPLHKGAYEDSANSADIASKRSICIVQNISIKSII